MRDFVAAGTLKAGGVLLPVTYCTRSTITEAWALVLGLPAPIDETDAAVLHRAAKQSIPGLTSKPTVVAVQVDQELAAPFWRQQVSWENERHLARFGHRYLSVHFVAGKDGRYETFEKSLRPSLDRWLALYQRTLTSDDDRHPIDRIGFGYVNSFLFAADGFDLSRYFKVSFGLDVGSRDAGLLGLETNTLFFDRKHGMHLAVNLAAESPAEDSTEVRVVTKVFAEKRGLDELDYGDVDAVRAILTEVKEAAKNAFFSFATPETHSQMGAVTDAAD